MSIYYAINASISSSTEPIPDIPNSFTKTFATLGDKKLGNVGPR